MAARDKVQLGSGPRIDGPMRDEDAAQLQLGPEFDGVAVLSYWEAKTMMEKRKGNRVENLPPIRGENIVFLKSQQYTQMFGLISSDEAARTIRDKLEAEGLFHPFEIAQLMNFLPEDGEEARALIPSLKRNELGDDVLNRILEEIQSLAS